MAFADLDGVTIYYEEYGTGTPIVWCHEYFGDYRSWAPQLTAFSRHHRNIVYSARGYPGSSVFETAASYSQDLMIADLLGLLDHLSIERAVIAGLSMGGNVALNFGLRHPHRCSALVIAGCGSGSVNREEFERGAHAMLERIERDGMAGVVESLRTNPTRLPMIEKDPAGFAELCERLGEHSAVAAGHIYREVQLRRPSVLTLGTEMLATPTPALIIVGDHDAPCIEPGLFMWNQLPDARLAVLPATGHCVNLEEPHLFNAIVGTFLADRC